MLSEILLVLCNRLAALLFAIFMIYKKDEPMMNQANLCFHHLFHVKAPVWKYFLVSMANVYATTCQYEALKYVSFTVQILGKSFKPLTQKLTIACIKETDSRHSRAMEFHLSSASMLVAASMWCNCI